MYINDIYVQKEMWLLWKIVLEAREIFIRVIHQEICGQIRREWHSHKVFLKNQKNAEVLKLGLLYPCVRVIAPLTEAEPEPIYDEL